MAEKKERCKFTIQFNDADPGHEQVIAILNQQGRRKAQFLVNAVLHYFHCSETPDIPQAPPTDTKMIETVVRRILEEQNTLSSNDKPKIDKPMNGRQKTSEDIHFNEAVDALGSEGLASIANTMAMFRRD